jgi:hypothetical protein
MKGDQTDTHGEVTRNASKIFAGNPQRKKPHMYMHV